MFVNDNFARRRSYAVLDVELLNANEEYAVYRKLDPRASSLRWPFRRVCAAALLTFSVDEDDLFEFGHLDSFVGDDEAGLLRALFDRLQFLPDHQIVTWGGLSCDLLVIRMSAMEHGLRLPRQLVHGARDHGRWLHRDLAVEFKGGGGSYVHLSEIACRLKLPVKFADKASQVPLLLANGKLKRLVGIAEADVVTTALALCAHLAIHGELVGAKVAQALIMQRVADLRPEAKYRDYLLRVAGRIWAEAEERCLRAAI